MAWVYILQSLENKKFYTGSTNDLRKRVAHHMGGFTPSTKRLGDIKLVFSQEFTNLKEARVVERKLKRLKRRDYIEKIIAEGKIRMKGA